MKPEDLLRYEEERSFEELGGKCPKCSSYWVDVGDEVEGHDDWSECTCCGYIDKPNFNYFFKSIFTELDRITRIITREHQFPFLFSISRLLIRSLESQIIISFSINQQLVSLPEFQTIISFNPDNQFKFRVFHFLHNNTLSFIFASILGIKDLLYPTNDSDIISTAITTSTKEEEL